MTFPAISNWVHGFTTLFDTMGALCFVKNREGRYLYASKAICQLLGLPPEQVLGRLDADIYDLDRCTGILEHDRLVLELGEEVHGEEQVAPRGREARSYWSIKLPLRDDQGVVQGLAGISSDITQVGRHTAQLLTHHEVLNTILEHIDAYIYIKDHEGRYLYVNPKVAELFGGSIDEILGKTDEHLSSPDVAQRLREFDNAVLRSGKRIARQELLLSPDHKPRHFWSIKLPVELPGAPSSLIGFSTEITELLELRQSLESQRTTDQLTGLGNRQRFEAELDTEMQLAERAGTPVAVVLLNLDQFQITNNSLGQAVGNQLLREVADRLRAQTPNPGRLARLFGDQFAYVISDFSSADQVAHSVERVRRALSAPYRVDEQTLSLTASAGIALYPDDGRTCESLISHAETAMHHAKSRGRNRYLFYSRSIGEAVSLRLQLERDLRAALEYGQFELYCQPKIHADGHLHSLEALIRWNRPGHGLVAPDDFIPLAEQTGLIDAIGSWVIGQACRQMAIWRELGLGQIQVAVNLSPVQLRDPAFVEWVARIKDRHDIADDQLEMEITESMMMEEPEQTIALLNALRERRISLSIDDFGTGYSSMAYLKRIPVNTLKLDRVFIANIDTDEQDADLCAGMIALAHKLGLRVVAEGVETRAQHNALAQRDCDIFQGYLHGHPLPAEATTRYLERMSVNRP